MVVDADLRVLCCLICQVAFPPDHVSSHIDSAHPGLQVDENQYSQAISEMEIAMILPNGIIGGRSNKAYRGLKVYDGIACDACTFVCGSKDWMRKHHQTEHSSLILPKQWSSCKMQQLNKGGNKRFWQVANDKEPLHDYQEVIERLRREMKEVTRVEQIPQEKRMVSPWLMTTKWHEHVAGHDISMLRKLVEIPKADDATMPHLQQAVEAYFRHAQTLLEVTDELILQRLNSPDPVKG
jgi:hypothetical protein